MSFNLGQCAPLSVPLSCARARSLSFLGFHLPLLSNAWTCKQDTSAKSIYQSVTPFTKTQHSMDRVVTRLVIPPMYRQGTVVLKVYILLNIFEQFSFVFANEARLLRNPYRNLLD